MTGIENLLIYWPGRHNLETGRQFQQIYRPGMPPGCFSPGKLGRVYLSLVSEKKFALPHFWTPKNCIPWSTFKANKCLYIPVYLRKKSFVPETQWDFISWGMGWGGEAQEFSSGSTLFSIWTSRVRLWLNFSEKVTFSQYEIIWQ